MGTIAEKLAYLSDAVDDIQSAINEKGVEVSDSIPLATYGDKIREIESGSGIDTTDFMSMFGARPYSVTTVTPVTHTYTSL